MKKLFLIIFISIFILNKVFSNEEKNDVLYFRTDEKYLKDKFYLKNVLQEKWIKEFIKSCQTFSKINFPESVWEEACIIQLLMAKAPTRNILKIENEFYRKYKKRILELQFWWDIMLSRSVWARNKTKWYDRILKNFNPNSWISKNVILFYNLESPFSEQDLDEDKQGFIFKANKKNIEVLNELKWKNTMFLSLANNHITNAWWAGIDTSLELLKENEIITIWVGREKEDFKKITKDWVKLCFAAYTYDWQTFYSRDKDWKVQKYFINKIDKEKITKTLENMKNDNCDFKALSLHWWVEYSIKPSKTQVNLGHELIDAWADLIIWSHSHVPWEVEDYKGKKIYYSLWNFIFDQDWWKNTKEKWVDYIYDEVLGKNTVPTYIWNTFYNKYEIIWDKVKLIEEKNIKHRISWWELYPY